MIPFIQKTFRGGTSDENDKGVAGAFKYGHGLDIHGKNDVLVCGIRLTTATTLSTVIRHYVTASDGTTYAFGASGSIFARSGGTGGGDWNYCYNDENGEIKGAGEWKESDGNNYLFWATNTSIARCALNGSLDTPWVAGVATQDYKTTLDPATWHIIKALIGSLLIANGNYLAEIEYDGDFNAQKLNIQPGNTINCLDERDDYAIMGSSRDDDAEDGHIWSWITTASNYIQKKKIPADGVNALVDTELRMLQTGADGDVFLADFGTPIPLFGVPGGGQVNPGGVTTKDKLALFGFYGGTYPGIWSYGRKRINRPRALNYEYRLVKTASGSTVTELGAITNVAGTVLASWATADDYGVDETDLTGRDSAVYESLEFDGGAPHLKKQVNTIHVVMDALVDGCAISAKYIPNKGETWRYAVTGGGLTTFATANQTEAIFTLGDTMNIYEYGIELTPSGGSTPKVSSVVAYLSDSGKEF